jgi:hypothetical protein
VELVVGAGTPDAGDDAGPTVVARLFGSLSAQPVLVTPQLLHLAAETGDLAAEHAFVAEEHGFLAAWLVFVARLFGSDAFGLALVFDPAEPAGAAELLADRCEAKRRERWLAEVCQQRRVAEIVRQPQLERRPPPLSSGLGSGLSSTLYARVECRR